MVHRHAVPTRGGGRAKQLLLVLIGVVAFTFAVASGPASTANAAWTNSFCANAWLQPYGQAGDNCVMGQGYANHYSAISVLTQARAGCVAATGYYGEQVMSWACAGAYSQTFVYPPNPAGWYRGTIRNNNLSYAAGFSGGAYCDPTICV